MKNDCIFCKIISGEIPSDKVYEDEWCIAFKDIKPIAPTHLLIVPRQHFTSLNDSPSEDLMAHLLAAVPKVARQVGVAEKGYRTIINSGKEAGQEVFHCHIHVVGGRQLGAMG